MTNARKLYEFTISNLFPLILIYINFAILEIYILHLHFS